MLSMSERRSPLLLPFESKSQLLSPCSPQNNLVKFFWGPHKGTLEERQESSARVARDQRARSTNHANRWCGHHKAHDCLRSPHSKQPPAWFTLGTPIIKIGLYPIQPKEKSGYNPEQLTNIINLNPSYGARINNADLQWQSTNLSTW